MLASQEKAQKNLFVWVLRKIRLVYNIANDQGSLWENHNRNKRRLPLEL